MSTSLQWLQAQNATIIYIGDPMCSWCYGFAPEISTLKAKHPELEFKLVMGGLRPYHTEKITSMSDFLRGHWDEIGKRTGQPFSYDILENENFVYDTEPAARAVVVARSMKPELEFDFFKAVQSAFYAQNKNTQEIATYLELAKQFKLDEAQFEQLFNSQEIKDATRMDFTLSQQMKVRGFPTVIVKKNDQFTMISNGFMSVEALEKNLQKALK